MSDTEKQKTIISKKKETTKSLSEIIFIPRPDRTIEWLGGVNYDNLQKTLTSIKDLMIRDSSDEIHLLINSYGGPTGIGMSFYDAVNSWLKPKLVTIGSGDVDSSGIILLLSGQKRYLTKNTTMLLHLAGRTFEQGRRFTTTDMHNMLKEDKLKDYQYACVISECTKGRYSPEKVLQLMSQETILTAEEAVAMNLADKVLE